MQICDISNAKMQAVVNGQDKDSVNFLYSTKKSCESELQSYVNNFKSLLDDAASADKTTIYNSNIEGYREKITQLTFANSGCVSMQVQTRNGINTAIAQINESEKIALAGFAQKQAELDASAAQIMNSQTDLESGKAQYYDGLKKFTDAKNSAMSSLNEAEAKLNNSQDEINNLEEAKFFVMDRTKNFGAINFNNDAERIASIANVFPLIFFFVALLVALTSMTRMIEEERIAIGTHKALGFSPLYISLKYLLYGVISSFVGSLVGLLILTQVLPYIIMFAYSIMYKMPIPLPMPFDVAIGALSIGAGIGVTLIATLMAAFTTLRLVPALLMIPTAPKAGKRILLEYIRPL